MPSPLPDRCRPASEPELSAGRATKIIVRARDLDTDVAQVIEIPAVAPPEPDRQRLQLLDTVVSLHPEARIKSFADAVASFVSRQHLIVASYADPVPRARRASATPARAQEALF
jgi:hypothetical protein